MERICTLLLLLCLPIQAYSWGFFAHKRINWLAVMTLPPEMTGFYKRHIGYIVDWAVLPDERRYAVPWEAPRHYIDLDHYGDSAYLHLPRYWPQAIEKYGEDTLMAYGTVPWTIVQLKYQLTEAFKNLDGERIVKLSAELGHYVADAHVPLHTTENYNGQLTNQHGIHAFWESRLPELFADGYDYFLPRAVYVRNPQLKAWDIVTASHLALDSVLRFERDLTAVWGSDKKYGYTTRNGINTLLQTPQFSGAYHTLLAGQVERRMREAAHAIGCFWLTCWADAGQPDLKLLKGYSPAPTWLEEEREQLKPILPNARGHAH
jgi:hypothetical protein